MKKYFIAGVILFGLFLLSPSQTKAAVCVVSQGCTATSTFYGGGVLYSPGGTNPIQAISTSSLGIISGPFITVCSNGCNYTDIQSAVSAAHANSNGGTIFIEAGTYTLSGHIILYDNIDISGTPSTTIQRAANVSFEGLFVNQNYLGSSTAQNTNIKIHDLTFDDGGSTNGYNEFRHAIGVYGVNGIEIYNVKFTNLSGDGIYLSSTSGTYNSAFYPSSNIRVFGNDFEGTQQNRNGISVIDANNFSFFGNNFYKMAASTSPGAIDLEPNDTNQHIQNGSIVGNTFESSGKNAIQMYNIFPASGNFYNVTIDGNNFNNSSQFDIYGQSWANLNIGPNTYRNSLSRAIEIVGISSVNIDGGSIYFPQSSAIHIQNSGAGVNVTGTTIISPGGHGIWLDNTDNANISGDTIRSWGVASTTFYAAVYGNNGADNANISGNVFDDVTGQHYGINTVDTSTGWRIGQNQVINASSTYQLVNTNYIASSTTGTNTGDQTTSNSDGTITVASGTTTPVVSLNLSHANTWTGGQIFGNSTSTNFFATNATGTNISFTNGVLTNATTTNANIPALSNLTTNGFVKTGSGNGTLSVDGNTYLTGNQTITLTGAVTGSGATTIATTYAGVQSIATGGTGTTTKQAVYDTLGYATSSGVAPNVGKYIPFTAFKTGVDLTQIASTTIFRVPAGMNFMVTSYFAVVTSVTSPAADALTAVIIDDISGNNVTQGAASAATSPTVGMFYYGTPTTAQGPWGLYIPAGDQVMLKVSNAQTSTTNVATVYVNGFYF